MTALLTQAEGFIKVATAAGGVDRQAATRWYQLLQQAQGQEAEQIAYMGEALLVAARGPLEQSWVEGLVMGGPKQAKAQEQRQQMAQAAQRSDAEEPDGEIDWSNVASEAAAMLELNKAANEAWAGQGGRDPEDS